MTDLTDFKTRRVVAFRKNFVELVELELKHAKVCLCLVFSSRAHHLFLLPQAHVQLLKTCIASLKEESAG